jgi:large subunit ribosomal protein L6
MSRIGKAPIQLANGVKVKTQGTKVFVEGPKGKLEHTLAEGVSVKEENGTLVVKYDESVGGSTALQGVTRTVIANMVHGAGLGFQKELEINGVGFRAAVKGTSLSLTLGFSHSIDYAIPTGVTAKVEGNNKIVLTSADKVLLGMVADKIRGFRPPEPYQGKGIKYSNEKIIRKAGKAAGAGK